MGEGTKKRPGADQMEIEEKLMNREIEVDRGWNR